MQFAQYVALALALAAGLATADPIPQPGTSDAHVGTLADRAVGQGRRVWTCNEDCSFTIDGTTITGNTCQGLCQVVSQTATQCKTTQEGGMLQCTGLLGVDAPTMRGLCSTNCGCVCAFEQ